MLQYTTVIRKKQSDIHVHVSVLYRQLHWQAYMLLCIETVTQSNTSSTTMKTSHYNSQQNKLHPATTPSTIYVYRFWWAYLQLQLSCNTEFHSYLHKKLFIPI